MSCEVQNALQACLQTWKGEPNRFDSDQSFSGDNPALCFTEMDTTGARNDRHMDELVSERHTVSLEPQPRQRDCFREALRLISVAIRIGTCGEWKRVSVADAGTTRKGREYLRLVEITVRI